MRLGVSLLVVLVLGFLLGRILNAPKSDGGFEDVHVIFFAGGSPDHYFAKPVHAGARDAARNLGCQIDFIWSEWDLRRMALQFKEAIEKQPDAICIMGHPGDEVMQPLVAEAIRKGIIVTSLNVPLPRSQAAFGHAGFGYFGASLTSYGSRLAELSVKQFNLESNDTVAVFGVIGRTPDSTASFRSQGCVEGFKKSGLNPVYVEVGDSVYDFDRFLPTMQKFLEEYPDVKAIISDTEPDVFLRGLKACQVEPNQISVATFDLSEGHINGMEEGYIHLIGDQQPYLQGYLPVLQACLTHKYGLSALTVDTAFGYVDATNLEETRKMVSRGVR